MFSKDHATAVDIFHMHVFLRVKQGFLQLFGGAFNKTSLMITTSGLHFTLMINPAAGAKRSYSQNNQLAKLDAYQKASGLTRCGNDFHSARASNPSYRV